MTMRRARVSLWQPTQAKIRRNRPYISVERLARRPIYNNRIYCIIVMVYMISKLSRADISDMIIRIYADT